MAAWWAPVALFWAAAEVLRRSGRGKDRLRHWGLSLAGPGVLLWETTRLNGPVNALGQDAWRRRYGGKQAAPTLGEERGDGRAAAALDVFYTLGVVAFGLAQAVLFALLVLGAGTSLWRAVALRAPAAHVLEAAALKPLIPGYNLPSSDLPQVGLALVLTLAFHELGHALAATSERVATQGSGLFLAVLVPGAFVRLEEGLLPQLPPRAQLKTFCAGAWHNAALALLATVSIKTLPLALWPMYADNRSPGRFGMALDLEASPFAGLPGVRPDDTLVSLDGRLVNGPAGLAQAITTLDARAAFAEPLSLALPALQALPAHGRDGHDGHGRGASSRDNVDDHQVVQLQGLCVDPSFFAAAPLAAAALGDGARGAAKVDARGECFVVDSLWTAEDGGAVSAGGSHAPSHAPWFACARSSLVVNEARRFASQGLRADRSAGDRAAFAAARPGGGSGDKDRPPRSDARSADLRTCRRAADCGAMSWPSAGGTSAGSLGACARAVVGKGESLVAVVLGSGASFAWRGDALADGLGLALRPAPLRLRLWASTLARTASQALARAALAGGSEAAAAAEAAEADGSRPDGRPDGNKGGGGADAPPPNGPPNGSSNISSNGVRAWGDWAVALLVRLPSGLVAFLGALRDVSVSIGLLNALPIYGLDGHLAANQFVRLWLLASPPPQRPASGAAQLAHVASPRGDDRAAGPNTSLSRQHSDKSHRRAPPLPTVGHAAHPHHGGNSQHSHHINNHSHGGGGGGGDHDDEATAQLLRDQFHDWNALHARQKRLTFYVLGAGSALVAVNVALGALAVVM